MVYIAKTEGKEAPQQQLGGLNSWFNYIMENISPKCALGLGLTFSIMTICTIGFIIILVAILK